MSTFYGTSRHMLTSVAGVIDGIEDANDMDVHTITLILDGRHGEFNLRVEASDEDNEQVIFTAIAHHAGGITEFKKETP